MNLRFVSLRVEQPELRIREIIGRRAHGCIALYRHSAAIDTVFVLALRSQREAGYAERV